MNQLELQVVTFANAVDAIEQVRRKVFQEEQSVAVDLDFDGLDEGATQLMAYWNGEPVGTARIRYLGEQLAKIERVAVLKSFRGLGIGQALMQKAIDHLSGQKIAEVKVNAQIQVKNFYERLGFQQQGEPFYEAGILHIEMRRKLMV
ncbi:GNAT family N-acetyltransferase [Leptolyngbya sp. FACHB-711]|uniref:GNAT family N-acetyltransferase n=1 Tax=unclassified Leptolyngbya TaxID=2650499 RepID=UPI001683FB30|nr:GNAT family N-acetyltransferase [Leptolyngbya sp. FACHB-711]MBD1852250.1 GNAT family N-acetyltransferase [Cyanobacteria bacterium FACHB-502]MBD2023381.1 GNAT family N-acetyltransferase [Leptolyngbya sp. FACHB-711]